MPSNTLPPENRLAAVRELYDRLPSIECQGRCWNSCGPIDMSAAERNRLTELGVTIPVFTHEAAERWRMQEPDYCPALTSFGRCSVYEDRPLICRMWGVTEAMPCPYGCKPKGDPLPDLEAMLLIQEANEVGGEGPSPLDHEKLRQFMTHPEIGPLLARFLRGDDAARIELEERFS